MHEDVQRRIYEAFQVGDGRVLLEQKSEMRIWRIWRHGHGAVASIAEMQRMITED